MARGPHDPAIGGDDARQEQFGHGLDDPRPADAGDPGPGRHGSEVVGIGPQV